MPSNLKNTYKYRKRPRRTDQYDTRVCHDFYISTITLEHIYVTRGARRPKMAAFVAWNHKLGAADLKLESRWVQSDEWWSMRRVVVSDERWFVNKRHVTHHTGCSSGEPAARANVTWPRFLYKFGADRQKWVMVGRHHPIHDFTGTEVNQKLIINLNAVNFMWPKTSKDTSLKGV